ncbi:methyltransferase type 11 [Planomonospora parontospora subsp. parontospora]|uniref:Methyltransferase type 11 n=2 Tax=Planomonospora parontospora TaxID=58119 RepID=A0AA37BJ67_9ACTN|nr:methyltransferase domain-containing protein [Planomonospora parontospora]GGK76787.1 methyltransferase type 11 [Planomonospora parontospora]GII10088.1 methyltransferase type 11 [Planomonospora parontospora subsp. parontospora]
MKTNTRRPVFGRIYPRLAAAMDEGGMVEHRRALLAHLAGQVIEVGAGHGVNFAHYPPAVTGVLAVEPEPRLRKIVRAAAAAAPVPVEVAGAVAEHLPVADRSADAVVFCLVLCSLPDAAAALAEARRVLRPGGRLRFLEHGRADSPGLVRLQRLLDATVWPRLAGGCHTGRDTVAVIERAGFTITALERFLLPEARTPFSFHTRGTAMAATDR